MTVSRDAVAVVDEVVNAGSAARATIADLRAGLVLAHAAELESRIWTPSDCPLCAAGAPLEDPGGQAPPGATGA